MARTKNVFGNGSRTTTRAVPATAGAANTKAKKPKGKAASRQASQPPEQPSPRRKRLTTKSAAAAAAVATVATRSSPVHSTRAATPTISSPTASASELPLPPAVNEPIASTSSPGPTRALRPRTPRAQPYVKPSPKSRRSSARDRSSTPAPSLDADESSDNDSSGPVTPFSTPPRPSNRAFGGGSSRSAARKPVGKSPLSKCVMTADDLEAPRSPTAEAVIHIESTPAPTRISNRGTLLAAPLLLSVTWGVSFSGVDDDELAAATTLVHWCELRQSATTSAASPGRSTPVC